ncbi:MAG: glycosyltransferase family 39 protein [Acidobacteriota bacterium]
MGAGLGLRDPWPADEPRYALVGREMVETGEWLIPHRAGEPYPDKPPLFFWMIALAWALPGSLRLSFLLPSLAAGLAVVLLIHDLARRLWHRRVAWLAGLAALSTVQLVLQARTAQIDMVLTLLTTLALYGLLRHLLLGPAWGWWYLAWAAVGAGVLTKGVGFLPLLVLVPYAIARARRWPGLPRFRFPALHLLLGALVFLAVAGAWLAPVLLRVATSGDPALATYRDNLLFKQTGERYLAAWHHLRWPGYYLFQVAPWAWLPLTLALPWLLPAWWRRLRRREARTFLLVGWVVLVLAFFTLSPGKRGVYLTPAAPAFVLACAPLLPGLLRRRAPRRLALAAVGLLSGALAAVAAWAWLAPPALIAAFVARNDLASAVAFATPVAALALTGAALAMAMRRNGVLALFSVLIAAWLVAGWWLFPAANPARSAAPFMRRVGERIGPGAELALAGWKEQFVLHADRPVVTFGYGREDFATESQEAARWVLAGPNRHVLSSAEALSACFDRERCIALGQRHRRDWFLAPAAAVREECRRAIVPLAPQGAADGVR